MGGHYPRVPFKSVICCELMSMDKKTGRKAGALLGGGANNRRDVWPSKEEAYQIFKSRGTWKAWDDRVLRNYVVRRVQNLTRTRNLSTRVLQETGLRPTKEGDNGQGVTLKCSRVQESVSLSLIAAQDTS